MGLALVIAAIVTAAIYGYQWTQSHYYVGESNGTVAIFRGVQQDLGPFPLSEVYQDTSIRMNDLPPFTRRRSRPP